MGIHKLATERQSVRSSGKSMPEMEAVESVAVNSRGSKFTKLTIQRNTCGPDDVTIDIKYCGICHSDVHFARDVVPMPIPFPLVPGHEIAGVVSKVGKNVKDIKVGDHAGVGCFVDSCLNCRPCKAGDENGCEKHATFTFSGNASSHGRIATDSGHTQGGYSKRMTVHRHFAIKIPKSYPLEAAGPIFCSGITMYTPLKQWGALKGGLNVGVVGIGGLGQMGVRLAAAMGNTVTAISTSPRKKDVAMKIGAKNFIVSKDEEQMKAAARSLDLILNTVSANHQVSTYLPLLAFKGKIVQIGGVTEPHQVDQMPLIFGMNTITGTGAGGLRDTQEVMDYCAKKGIKPDTELIDWTKIDTVYDELSGGSDKVVRYVLDCEKGF